MYKRQPHIAFEGPVDPESGPRRDADADPLTRHGQPGAGEPAGAHPQGEPAGRHLELPLRELPAQRPHQVVPVLPRLFTPDGHGLLPAARPQQPVDGELFQHRRAHVRVGARRDQAADDVRGRPYPADPHTGPECLAGGADGQDRAARGVERADPARHLDVRVQAQLVHGLVDHQDRARRTGGLDQGAALLFVGQGSGGVVEVGDDVGQPRCGIPQDLTPAVHVPAAEPLLHRHGHQPGARLPHQLKDVRVARGLHGDPLAASREEMADGVDGTHRPCGDHDLFGHRGDAASGVAVRDHLPQCGKAGRVVAVRVCVGRQFLQGALDGPRQPRLRGGQRGASQVDHRAERFRGQRFEAPGRQRVAGRYGGPAARSTARLQEALRPQRLVGGRDGGPAEGQGQREFPLGGEPRGDRDPALQDEQTHAVGEGAVGGRLAGTGRQGTSLLALELAGELCRTDGRSPLRHGNQSTFLGLAIVGGQSPATE